jgi:transmembrane sensor
MMKPEPPTAPRDRFAAFDPALTDVAASWVARRSHGLSPAERAAFERWLAADSAHAAAFAQASAARSEFDWPSHAGATAEILSGLERRSRRRRSRRLATAGALAAAVAIGWFAFFPAAPVAPEASAVAAAPVVVLHPARQVLGDGTIIDLRDGAEIAVEFTAQYRRVTLLHGEAHFAVAKNPERPFIVKAAGVDVRAVGTEFAVELGSSGVDVVVTEGKVAVEKREVPAADESAYDPPRLLASLTAGRRVRVDPQSAVATEVTTVSPEEVADRLAWRVPRLEFSRTPLSEVVALFNEHNTTKLVLAHPALGQLRLSGTLRADRIEALTVTLRSDFGVRIETEADRIVIYPAR